MNSPHGDIIMPLPTKDYIDESIYEDVGGRIVFGEIDLDTVERVIYRWVATDEPPPINFAITLWYSVLIAKSGRVSSVFKKPRHITKKLAHPLVDWLEKNAVCYINACKENNWDPHPVITISDVCGVKRSTVYRWIKKHGDPLPIELSQSDIPGILEHLKLMYPLLKPK